MCVLCVVRVLFCARGPAPTPPPEKYGPAPENIQHGSSSCLHIGGGAPLPILNFCKQGFCFQRGWEAPRTILKSISVETKKPFVSTSGVGNAPGDFEIDFGVSDVETKGFLFPHRGRETPRAILESISAAKGTPIEPNS